MIYCIYQVEIKSAVVGIQFINLEAISIIDTVYPFTVPY